MKYKPEHWIKAKKLYRLAARHIQMAKELGLNPTKFGKYSNHKQEPWKMPLREYIEHLYFKRFKKEVPVGFEIAPVQKPVAKKKTVEESEKYVDDFLGFHEDGTKRFWFDFDDEFSSSMDPGIVSENTFSHKIEAKKKKSKKPGHPDNKYPGVSVERPGTSWLDDVLPF